MADTLTDIWSGFDHKDDTDEAPGYVNDTDKRRINFYARARAYIETVGREYLTEDPDDPDKAEEWQEFGDPAVIVEQSAGAFIGDTITYRILGADDPVPSRPQYDDPPEEPDLDGLLPEVQAVEREIFEIERDSWVTATRAVVDRWKLDVEVQPFLIGRQDWLREWASDIRLTALITENEIDNVVPLGSGVFEMGWDGRRTNIEIIPPEYYFPDLADGLVQEFPDVVHLAYPFTDPDTDDAMIRRVTYELVPITGSAADTGDGTSIPAPAGGAPKYHGEGDEWTHACLKTDAVYDAGDFQDVYGDDNGSPRYEMDFVEGTLVTMDEYPIGLDFIPVVHIPNTLSRKTHFGRSSIARLGQLFDEIAATDGDESLASRWAGQPPVGVSGMEPGEDQLDLTPGKGTRLGPDGSISTIPMAENLQQIGERLRRLLKRLSVVSSIPEGMLGRTDPGTVASGKLLSLSFVAFEQLVKRARMAREKYSLIPKFSQRIAIQNGALVGPVYDAEVVFGPYMPSDLAELAEILRMLISADSPLVSQETSLQMLQQAGVPSGNVEEELAAIRRIMVGHADQLTNALEDPRYAAAFLGEDSFEVDDGVDPEADQVTVPALAGAV